MKTWRWFAFASITMVGACGADAGSNGGATYKSLDNSGELPEHPCDGPHGLACSTGKFCATAEANRCPGLEITGVCRQTPDVCIHIYDPVCGCDGQTYGNDCLAAAATVAVAYEGACAPFCGGIAGLSCPGAGACVDNPTDGCHPAEGDADCGSLCHCEVIGTCETGAHWDGSPEVCGCVCD